MNPEISDEQIEQLLSELEEFKAALWAMREAWVARHGEDPCLWPADVLTALQPLGAAW
jgi:hypothetical protein